MPSLTLLPKSDVDVPGSGRKLSGRTTLRNSFRRDSLNDDDDVVPADELIARSDDDENSSARLTAALSTEREETRARLSRELEGEEDPSEETITMSLIDLLEETDRKAGIEGISYRFAEEGEVTEEEEDEVVEEVRDTGGDQEVTCSMCKVKHKGEALVPCGHAYCRLCAKDMWVQKGHCPVCSSFVLEILEIF